MSNPIDELLLAQVATELAAIAEPTYAITIRAVSRDLVLPTKIGVYPSIVMAAEESLVGEASSERILGYGLLLDDERQMTGPPQEWAVAFDEIALLETNRPHEIRSAAIPVMAILTAGSVAESGRMPGHASRLRLTMDETWRSTISQIPCTIASSRQFPAEGPLNSLMAKNQSKGMCTDFFRV